MMLQNAYFYITPLSVALLLSEYAICKRKKLDYFNFQDTFASIGTAILNQLMNLVVAALVFWSYGLLWEHRLWEVPNTTAYFLLLLFIIDFIFYWFHRWGHEINILWAAHMPHHTSDEMNIAVGLRASLTQRLFSFLFYWPLVLFGFEPRAIYLATAVHLFLGLWHHTRVIGKLGWYELIFNSPSHHRVHHAINRKYIDKNYAELLIIWDRMFGTFEPEREPAVFGVSTHPQSWNPVKINLTYWSVLWQDFLAADHWSDRVKIWFKPLGWRPRNLPPHAPLPNYTIDTYPKFTGEKKSSSKAVVILKYAVSLSLLMLVIDSHSTLGITEKIGLALLCIAVTLF